eukprot:TRINITY_DN16876_c0_g2_i2.p1 TRINITY_DN16876_c0_g2~~TRINITY_DN16876_c0_g2_i2.p1  ORF type:complete len:102 (+),score=3.20 TRINITY_DN16876_c0_g2_i2:117-422(+)
MLRSLVGSEMCIRDRCCVVYPADRLFNNTTYHIGTSCEFVDLKRNDHSNNRGTRMPGRQSIALLLMVTVRDKNRYGWLKQITTTARADVTVLLRHYCSKLK